MSDLRFDGRVVLVTGAGQGIGRVYALEFAKRGASVVVNDLGSTQGGVGKTAKVADGVVQEIRKGGGTAVANYDSVEFGDKLVETALDNFGRIDVVINNAGIIRDRTFQRMSEEEWDIIQKVHLRGAFSVTKAAWSVMREQKFGRIIMTSSPSGIYGNFGQTNYSAAKLGLLGFANTLSLEGRKYNIFVNTIAPTAFTRLTKNLMPPESAREMKPEYVMPLVIYLCHESCTETGGLFELSGGFICKLRWQRTKGALLREVGKEMRPEDVRDNWNAVVNWDEPEIVSSTQEATLKAGEAISKMLAGENDLASNHPIKPRLAKAHIFEPVTTSHSETDVILYALGIGASTTQNNHLKFLFELNDDFCVIPSFGVIPSFKCMALMTQAEGLTINPAQILHGEQYLELFKPIPVCGTFTSKMKISEVLDKGSGAAIVTDVETFDENGEKLLFNQSVTFLVGSGGFRGKRSSDVVKPVVKAPNRPHDAEMEEKTNLDQAALYRLNGDPNPLHIDPAFAAMGGFKQPILHGLCSFGYATRHVMKTFANNDPTRIKAIKARFSKPVLPGQTLRTLMWKEGNRIHFETVVKESGAACLSGAYIDLRDENTLASDDAIRNFSQRLSEEMVRKVGAIVQWDVTKDGKVAKSWDLDLSKSSGSLREGISAHPNLIITLPDDVAVEIFTGKVDPSRAYSEGKISLKGAEMIVRTLKILFSDSSRL